MSQQKLNDISNSINDDSSCNLIINYLPPNMNEGQLSILFSPYGKMLNCKIVIDLNTGRSRGYGFVKYDNDLSAKRALNSLNGFKIQGKKLKVAYARPQSKEIQNANLYITNIPLNYNIEMLKKHFKMFGKIVECRILTDSNGNSRGVGFVRMDTHYNAIKALNKRDGCIIEEGCPPILVKLAQRRMPKKWKNDLNNSSNNSNNNINVNNNNGFNNNNNMMHNNNINNKKQRNYMNNNINISPNHRILNNYNNMPPPNMEPNMHVNIDPNIPPHMAPMMRFNQQHLTNYYDNFKQCYDANEITNAQIMLNNQIKSNDNNNHNDLINIDNELEILNGTINGNNNNNNNNNTINKKKSKQKNSKVNNKSNNSTIKKTKKTKSENNNDNSVKNNNSNNNNNSSSSQNPVNIIVYNLPNHYNHDHLIQLYARFGPVQSVNIHKMDSDKIVGVITYFYYEDAKRAQNETNGRRMNSDPKNGERLRVVFQTK